MKNNIENMADMQRMQQEAVRRVHEMQRRAKQTLIGEETKQEICPSNNSKTTESDTIEQSKKNHCVDEKKHLNENKKCTQIGIGAPLTPNLFSTLVKDPEKSLILLLILLLLDEATDISLVFALMYLLI